MIQTKYTLARLLSRFLPPIIAQKMRSKIITIKEAEMLALDFKRKSFTGSYFLGNTVDFHAFKFSIHGYFDWRNVIISKTIIKNFIKGDVIEVGANIGTETIGFTDVTSKFNLKTYAYEPIQENIRYLENFINYNQLSNLYIFQSLVSDYNGTANFKVPTKNDSGSGFISNNQNDERFDVVKLDDQHSNQTISLICVDVEGFEYQVLKGAQRLLSDMKPYIIVEVNENYLKNRAHISLNEFYEYFKTNGYTSFYIKPLGLEKIVIDNFKVFPNKNWLCIPNEMLHTKNKIAQDIFFAALNPTIN
jgi:FkbM family methyltransferase